MRKRALVALTLLLPILSPLVVNRSDARVTPNLMAEDPIERHPQGGGGPSILPADVYQTWRGGAFSLPYGEYVGTAAVLAWARSLASVQPVVERYARRGYVRRPEYDCATVGQGYASAVLVFGFPNAPDSNEVPVIQIITKPINTNGQPWPSTQIFGWVYTDSAGYVVPSNKDRDSALFVYGTFSSSTTYGVTPGGRRLADPNPMDYQYKCGFCAAEWQQMQSDMPQLQQYACVSPGMRMLMEYEAGKMLRTSIAAYFMAMPHPAAKGVGLGLILYNEHVQFWESPPDTSQYTFIGPPSPFQTPPTSTALPDHSATEPRPVSSPRPSMKVVYGGSGSVALTFAGLPGARASIRILDIQGRLVRTLTHDVGSGSLAWDMKDDAGRRVQNSVYFAQASVKQDGREEMLSAKVLVAN